MSFWQKVKKYFKDLLGIRDLEITPNLSQGSDITDQNGNKPKEDFVIEKKEDPREAKDRISSKVFEQLQTNEILPFTEEVLDTESADSVAKLQHNLQLLISQAKEKGKVDKFMLIREDDFFPEDWKWSVLSKDTNLEKETTSLSFELRKMRAMEESGIEPFKELMGMKVPTILSNDEMMKALSKVDKTYGNVLLPSRFRSTKHFTVNTPLGVTGDYNAVETDRDFIIIDDMSQFLKSEYGYSVSYHDAYLDVSHEGLPISENAVVLINDENYERIMSDEKRAKQLAERRVVRFKGDETVAIDMVLTEMGALPSRIGSRYAQYDNEISTILDDSIKNLAEENGLFHDKSHAGRNGHFSSYYDDKNQDYNKSLQEFIGFLRDKFKDNPELFPEGLRLTESTSEKILETLGTKAVSDAIEEFNTMVSTRFEKTSADYKKERASITPEVHKQFVQTIHQINDFYKTDPQYESYEARVQTEEAIRKFIQSSTVAEQLEAGKAVAELLPTREVSKEQEEIVSTDGTISMQQYVLNAGKRGISAFEVQKADDAITQEELKSKQVEGEISKDD